MRTDGQIIAQWDNVCGICGGTVGDAPHVHSSLVPLEVQPKNSDDCFYTKVYVICNSCHVKGELI